ncbi:MAG: ATP-binding cassette domain-containing protein [Dehalogenimonas sp.]|uniref:Oligopeptide/dipeptide ABC transporter ATP-binding protein n=1 Tax=Candidatus Dehalogenimonas loeffleri TaxID=3127115 RepID=A0ABZ2J6N7_9CHLR|nr:ATP-binding cassette domain-containing protein [Dehalogenimonas sp.]
MPESEFTRKIRWKKLAWVPQNTKGSLDPRYSINDHFEELFQIHNVPDALHNTAELLDSVGLSSSIRWSIPDRLSGGEIQRSCIALALALSPSLLILDEPTSALDPSLKGQIIALLGTLKTQRDASYLFITHDIHQAISLCEEFIVLYAGHIMEQGSRESVFNNPIHPYTKKLLECVSFNIASAPPKYITGEPPRLGDLPPGCPFWPRCEKADAECKASLPLLEDKGSGHYAACFKS